MPGLKKALGGTAGCLMLAAYFGFGLPETRLSIAQEAAREKASFPHDKPEHRKLECSKCHSVTTAKPNVDVFPGHAACVSCHNFAAMTFTREPVLFCGICHQGRPVSKQEAALFAFPKSGLKSDFGIDFSHVSHMKPLPANSPKNPRCTDCHVRAHPVRTGLPEVGVATGHLSCFKCHGERPVKPPGMNQCAGCHKVAGPHSPGLFGALKEFKHSDHDLDTRPRTKREFQRAKAEDFLCSQCHSSVVRAKSLAEIRLPEAGYCGECHNGRIGLPDQLPSEILDKLKRR